MFDPQAVLQTVEASRDAAIPKDELDRRLVRLRERLKREGIDLLLLVKPENIFYLSGQQTLGYYTFQCLAVPAEGECFLLLWELEGPNARSNTYISDIIEFNNDTVVYSDSADGPTKIVEEVLAKKGWKGRRIAIEQNSWFLSIGTYRALEESLGKLIDASGIVEPLRRVKSAFEIKQIEMAAAAADAGVNAALPMLAPGVTENDVAAVVHEAMIRAGSEWVAMGPFISSGWRSGLRHSTWRRRRLESGDALTLEVAAAYNRYHAAIFRTAMIGPAPDRIRRARDVCRDSIAAAFEKLKPGNTCADVHNAAYAVLAKSGYSDNFRKRAGYSMGIAFAPGWGEGDVLDLSPSNQTLLESGMAFHIPISLCIYGEFVVCVSETALVTPTGSRRLSTIPECLF